MRFGSVHRVMINLLVLLGLLSLLTSGELNRWMSAAIVALLAIAFVIPERYEDHVWLRRAGLAAALTAFAVQNWRLWVGGEDLLPLAVEFAAALQVIRLLTRRGAAYDQQIILLALLHLVAGTVLGGGLSYGLCFIGFLVVAPAALVLSHLRREVEGNYRQGARDRTGLPVGRASHFAQPACHQSSVLDSDLLAVDTRLYLYRVPVRTVSAGRSVFANAHAIAHATHDRLFG